MASTWGARFGESAASRRRFLGYLANKTTLPPLEVSLGPCPRLPLPLDPVGEQRDRPTRLGERVLVEVVREVSGLRDRQRRRRWSQDDEPDL